MTIVPKQRDFTTAHMSAKNSQYPSYKTNPVRWG